MSKRRADTPAGPARLTARQEAFVREYLVDLNATQAAIRAGYSARTARSQGQRMLTNVDIVQAVAAEQSARAERVEITADDVLRGLHTEARRTGEGASHTARVSAWTALGKHLGLFVERVDHTTKGQAIQVPPIEIRILNAPRREASDGDD